MQMHSIKLKSVIFLKLPRTRFSRIFQFQKYSYACVKYRKENFQWHVIQTKGQVIYSCLTCLNLDRGTMSIPQYRQCTANSESGLSVTLLPQSFLKNVHLSSNQHDWSMSARRYFHHWNLSYSLIQYMCAYRSNMSYLPNSFLILCEGKCTIILVHLLIST